MDVRKFWNPIMPGVSNRRAQQKLGRRSEKHVPLASPFHVPSMSMQLRPEHWDRTREHPVIQYLYKHSRTPYHDPACPPCMCMSCTCI